MKTRIHLLIITCTFFNSAFSQNNTSPYSILGIGDIETGYYGRWSGMGNAGVALSSNRYLNQANVASLSKLDDQFFVFEVSGRYKYTGYSGNTLATLNTTSADLSIKKVAAAIKLGKRWGSGVGLNPFSTSNYSFYSKKTLQGTNYQTDVYNQGSGGLNQIYWANSYRILKNLSVGIQTGYLFGSLNQTEELNTALSASTITTTRNIYLRKPYTTYAFQYGGHGAKKWEWSAGATYAAKTNLNAEYSLNVTDNTSTVVNEQVIKNGSYNVPRSLTAGVAITYDNKITLASDYRKQDWSSLNYKGFNYALVNSKKYSMGVEYSKKVTAWGASLERTFYQAGVFYNNSYLQLNQQQLKDYGFTLGIGGNSKRNSLGYQVSLELGSRGTTDNNLIKEKYSQLTFTLSYRDFWFTKGKKFD